MKEMYQYINIYLKRNVVDCVEKVLMTRRLMREKGKTKYKNKIKTKKKKIAKKNSK